MRLSFAQAAELGLISTEDARNGLSRQVRASRSHSRRNSARRRAHTGATCPQRILFNALRERLGACEVLWEVQGLIPGRRFRADIYLPTSRLVIEMDGFKYHRSKTAFQKDRLRQNLFVAHDYRVLRFFTSQIFGQLSDVVEQILQTHRS